MEPETVQTETVQDAPVLINKYRFDEDMLRASYREVMRPVMIIQLGIALVLLSFAVYYTVRLFDQFRENLSLLLLVLLVYAIAAWEGIRAVTGARRAAKRAVRRLENQHHLDAYDVTLRFCGEEIVTESDISEEPKHLPYSGFKRLRRGREVILLTTRSTLVYTLDPTRFENGTEADFWKLMNEKCPDAVPKKLRQG